MARPGLDRHVKFRRLVRILGEPRPHVRGYLELLWETAYENGQPVIGDTEAVEAAAEYPGEPGRLCDALLSCGGTGRVGFIEIATDVTDCDGTSVTSVAQPSHPSSPVMFQVHDLFDHCPEYVTSRASREDERRKEKVCEHCGTVYRKSDPRSKYCSENCRKTHWRDGSRDGSDGSRRIATDDDGTPTPTPTPTPTKEESLSVGTDDSSELLDQERQFVAQWNTLKGVAANRGDSLTDKRRHMFRARVRSPGWLQEATEAMAKFPLRVQVDAGGDVMPDAWRPDMEWFLAPDSVTKILEGKYDFTKANGNGQVRRDSPARIR